MMYEDLTLLSTQELLGLPPVQWLLADLIPKEGFGGLVGAPAGGKSFIALDWAMSISEGIPWGIYNVTQAPVVYVAAEGGRGIQQRVRAWMKMHEKIDLPAMYFLLSPLYVREEGTVEAFLSMLEDIDVWPGLIVLDTLSRSFGGGEENASADMGHFVDSITRLAVGRRMAALIVHHTNAIGNRERGSTAFRGAADAMFMCKATKDDHGRIIAIELKNDKQKDAAEMESIWLRPEAMHGSMILEHIEAPEKGKKAASKVNPMRTVDMLSVLGTFDEPPTWKEWRLACGIEKNTFNMRIRRLIENGDLIKDNGRYSRMPANIDLADTEVDSGVETPRKTSRDTQAKTGRKT